MTFVCKKCAEGDHCGRRDTWCDCQHRTPGTPEPARGENEPRG
jgi:hypothetical protein